MAKLSSLQQLISMGLQPQLITSLKTHLAKLPKEPSRQQLTSQLRQLLIQKQSQSYLVTAFPLLPLLEMMA
jgi:hypothetical protein